MCCSFRHRDDELLRGEEGGKTDHLHVDETGVLTRPHHLGLGEIPGALRPQRPQRAVRFQSRDERRKPPQIVAITERRENHICGAGAGRPHARAARLQFGDKRLIAFDPEEEHVMIRLHTQLVDSRTSARRVLHRAGEPSPGLAWRCLMKVSIVAV
ncbi:MAG: hypothetical protein DMF84_30630 [Acidobacteria bacterium]|nr:MAG: hypothetical protein DMF84_30630 [Acidobacteriota bacterium]